MIAGKHVWHRNNCVNCHTLLGEGAYYAPDLTKIAQHRGAPTCASFLKDPVALLFGGAGRPVDAEPQPL